MRAIVSVFGSALLAIAVVAAPVDDDKKNKTPEPKEKTVVDYDSKTHGAVQVKSASAKPVDSFNVVQAGKSEFSGPPELLDSTRELEPGDYVIDVNRSKRKLKVETGKKTVLKTGDLVVESKRDGVIWVPKQGKETMLASNPPIVNHRVALFPGTYAVFVNKEETTELKSLGSAVVKAGKKTVVKE